MMGLRLLAQRITLAVAGGLLPLVAIEVGARWFSPPLGGSMALFEDAGPMGYRLQPGATGVGPRGNPLEIDADGHRRDPEPPTGPIHLRVLLVGDSFVFGVGVSASDTLPAMLARTLRARTGCEGVEVLNAGIPGANLAQNRSRLEAESAANHPDVVVLALLENDIHNLDGPDHLARGDGHLRFRPGTYRPGGLVNPFGALGGVWLWLQTHSVAFRELSFWAISRRLEVEGRDDLATLAREIEDSPALADRLLRGEADAETEARLAGATLQIVDAARSMGSKGRGFRLLLLYRPEQIASPVLRGGHRSIAARSRAAGVSVVDPIVRLEAVEDPLSLFLFPGDHHPGGTGHRLVAEVLADALLAGSTQGALKVPCEALGPALRQTVEIQ
jgi:hypothetical protein